MELKTKLQRAIGKINIHIYDGGMSEEDVVSLVEIVSKLKNPQIAEVGSWKGCSTFILAQK